MTSHIHYTTTCSDLKLDVLLLYCIQVILIFLKIIKKLIFQQHQGTTFDPQPTQQKDTQEHEDNSKNYQKTTAFKATYPAATVTSPAVKDTSSANIDIPQFHSVPTFTPPMAGVSADIQQHRPDLSETNNLWWARLLAEKMRHMDPLKCEEFKLTVDSLALNVMKKTKSKDS